MKQNLKIAITGGIGSGKSLVSNFVESCGYPVIKSDDIAKELMLKDESVKKNIIKAFGRESYNENGLNTKYLSQHVFCDPPEAERIEKINSIVHPPTIKKIEELSNKFFETHKIVFIESALVYEAKIQKMFDFVVLIYSEERIRIQRAMERNKVSEEVIRKRMVFQIPDYKKKERAHFVIENNSTISELEKRTQFILNLLQSLVK
ncbi:MAG: dephospho-CoA kinase [Bacteroidota bacterium]